MENGGKGGEDRDDGGGKVARVGGGEGGGRDEGKPSIGSLKSPDIFGTAGRKVGGRMHGGGGGGGMQSYPEDFDVNASGNTLSGCDTEEIKLADIFPDIVPFFEINSNFFESKSKSALTQTTPDNLNQTNSPSPSAAMTEDIPAQKMNEQMATTTTTTAMNTSTTQLSATTTSHRREKAASKIKAHSVMDGKSNDSYLNDLTQVRARSGYK